MFVVIVCRVFVQISMSMAGSHDRALIVIPAHGMSEVRDILTDILSQYGTEEKSE